MATEVVRAASTTTTMRTARSARPSWREAMAQNEATSSGQPRLARFTFTSK